MFDKIVNSEFKTTCLKEFKFHHDRKWRLDYFIPEYKIAIEVEGGAFSQGRHTRGVGFINDMEKYNEVTKMGYRLLRYTPQQLLTAQPLKDIKAIILNKP